MIKIAPSILSADFGRLAEEIKTVEDAGADMIHVDVMDGHFVPNITIGQPVVKSIRKITDLPLDVHLMIQEPDKYLKEFAEAGADILTIHPEANTDLGWALQAMKDLGVKTGVALKPETPLKKIEDYLDDIEVVMIMTVKPGFGGQVFLPGSLTKLRELNQRFNGEIEVDGGINKNTLVDAVQAGANILVAGNAVFGSKHPGEALKELRKLADK